MRRTDYLEINSNGARPTASGQDAIALGPNAAAQAANAVAIGNGAQALDGAAVAIGLGNQARGDGAVAIGDPNIATGTGAVALGKDNTATGTAAIALGNASQAVGESALAAGNAAQASGASALALGNAAQAHGAGAIALGNGAQAGHERAVALGAGAASQRAGEVVLGGADSSVRLGDMAASTAAQVGPTDLVSVDASGTLGRDTVVRPMLAQHEQRIGSAEARLGRIESQMAADRRDARRGIAAAAALAHAPMPSQPGSVTYAANLAGDRTQSAVGASVAWRLRTATPMAITGGLSYGGVRSAVVRVGVAGEF